MARTYLFSDISTQFGILTAQFSSAVETFPTPEKMQATLEGAKSACLKRVSKFYGFGNKYHANGKLNG